MIVLEPEYVSYLINDEVYFLGSGQNFVVVNDFHYGVLNDRAKPVIIARNCEPGSELLFSNAKKPGININLYSITVSLDFIIDQKASLKMFLSLSSWSWCLPILYSSGSIAYIIYTPISSTASCTYNPSSGSASVLQ